MSKVRLFPIIGVALVAAVVAAALLVTSNARPYSSPEKSIAAFVAAEAGADLNAMEGPSSSAFYRNFIGHFGQAKYRQIRDIYQAAYDLADPTWEGYRQKAEAASLKEHESIAEQINKLGRDAFAALPEDQRLAMTDNRAKFEDFVFEEGLKGLPQSDREKIADPDAFRANKDIAEFTNREGFAQLSQQDQAALKSPAALSSQLTPDRMAFLESVGVPQLKPAQRQVIADIPSSQLQDPQEFMYRNGREPAREFLQKSALSPKISMSECRYTAEDDTGSLFKGSNAVCRFTTNVRGASYVSTAVMVKQDGAWKIVWMTPTLVDIREAYPPRRNRGEASVQTGVNLPIQVPNAQPNPPAFVQRPVLPYASWQPVTDSTAAAAGVSFLSVGLSRLFARLSTRFLTYLFVAGAIVVFCVIMTINFRRLRQERFLPEWLEGETQLEEIEVSHWWSRQWLRLTNKRIIQVRLSWLFSRRKIFGVALDDIHSVTWRRNINWLLVLIGIALFGRSNPVALLLLMWGLESRILGIRFNAPLAHLPLPRARASVTSFSRRQFNDLASFYKKAQLHLAQVRTQKLLPVPSSMQFIPEVDKDFAWGPIVWLLMTVWLAVALGERTLGAHVTLEGIWGGVVLGLPVAAASRSLRSGIWTGVLGAAIFVAVKFPGSIGLLLLDSSNDGGAANLWQYLLLLGGAALIAVAAYVLARVHELAWVVAPLLWLVPIALMQPSLLGESNTYAKCFIAIASAATLSVVTDAVSPRDVPTAVESEYASA